MRRPRFLWPPEASLAPGAEACLPPGESRHGVCVLRLRLGAPAFVLSSQGQAEAVVSAVERGHEPRLALRLVGPWRAVGPESGPRLALALLKPARFEWAVEKAVELGASQFIPLLTERTRGEMPSPARLARWQRLAEAAAKQCGRLAGFCLAPPCTLFELRQRPGFFLSPKSEVKLTREADDMLIAVGPEGGFSPQEEEMLGQTGWQPRSLGAVTLRAETAALAALARLL